MTTYCKICKKEVNGSQPHIWVRSKTHNSFGHKNATTFSQCYHNECFESIAGAEFVLSIKQCALCEERVSRTNSVSTICESCVKEK